MTSEGREPLPNTPEQPADSTAAVPSPVEPKALHQEAGGADAADPADVAARNGTGSGPDASAGQENPADPGVPTGQDPPDDDHGRDGTADTQPALSASTAVLLVSGFATVLLAAVAALLPVPYAALKPGPAINTLGSQGGKPLISVSDHATYPVSGSLDLTTVTVVGGPGGKLTLADIILGVLDPSVAVVPQDAVFPRGQTQRENQEENQREMTTSQEEAAAAALGELGIMVPVTMAIAAMAQDAPAAAVLRRGDVLLGVNGVRTANVVEVRQELQKVTAGQPVTVIIRRDGKEQQLTTRTLGAGGRTVLGIRRFDATFHLPFPVKIQINDVGGPSAGMMFALGIVDVLTPGEMTGGQHIAGTGTIDSVGVVGAIGGIQEKMIGARESGARWFLAPAEDCSEVVGNVPSGLRVVRVSTLHEAREAVTSIAAGTGDRLPTCTA